MIRYTDEERRAAAEIRINVDKKLGRKTPQWIINLTKHNKE